LFLHAAIAAACTLSWLLAAGSVRAEPPRMGQQSGKHVALTDVHGAQRLLLLGQRIGGGTYSSVYQARDSAGPEEFAAKIFRPEKLWEGKHSFVREHQVLSRLAHRGIPRSLGVGTTVEEHPLPALVTELVGADDLGPIGERWAPRPVGQSVRIIRQLLDIVDHMEKSGDIRHGDICPVNIRVTGERTWLIDFGHADTVGRGSRGAAEFFIAAEPGPPEVNGDVYSAGAVLVKLVTGEHSRGAIVRVPALTRPGSDLSLREVLERALHPDPRGRYPRARSLDAALAPFAGED
jgi:serine/threonine protein kinase